MTHTKKLYIIAGCNGAGKTTASFTILPEILDCREFVNADEIAKGLSPFQPEKVAFEAGRIMLQRIEDLMQQGVDFAFETTLSTRSYHQKIILAQERGYFVTLIFFWLDSVDLAKERVRMRVLEGGHDIPAAVIERRYHRGLKNLFERYMELCDSVMIFDNSVKNPNFVLRSLKDGSVETIDFHLFEKIKKSYHENKRGH
jgi:predicted ABC-type ATPase